MISFIKILLLIELSTCQQFYQIEDIPIEHFEQTDLQEDAIDFELMPRSARSYFDDRSIIDISEPINVRTIRSKRETTGEKPTEKTPAESIIIGLGKPLEVAEIDPENNTSVDESSSTVPAVVGAAAENGMAVNDFIRFRRSPELENMREQDDKSKELQLEKVESRQPQTEAKNSPKASVETFTNSRKLTVTRAQTDKEATREARGATNEQWVRQPLSISRSDDYDEDNYQSSSDNVRAPRVHFVTQNREDRYDREGRARSLNAELNRKLTRDMSAEMDAYRPRYTRPLRYDRRDDPYNYNQIPRNTRDPYRYDRMGDYYPEHPRALYDDVRHSPEKKPQRRIIYYATLPEIPRTQRDDDFRDRYDASDRYYDRYGPPGPDPYRYRYKGYAKPRYEENLVRGDKSGYPVKVTTDISVREVKKNPERRIYSDVSRSRYAQDAPYQPERI